jgi:hypothetical protein
MQQTKQKTKKTPEAMFFSKNTFSVAKFVEKTLTDS